MYVILKINACMNAISMVVPPYVQTDESIFEYVSKDPGDWNRFRFLFPITKYSLHI